MTKIFGFLYSNNFYNYKVVENMLNKENKMPKIIYLKNCNKTNKNLGEK